MLVPPDETDPAPRALAAVARTLTADRPLPGLLQAVMNRLGDVFESGGAGALWLWDGSAGRFRLAGTFGCPRVALARLDLAAGESLVGRAYDSGTMQQPVPEMAPEMAAETSADAALVAVFGVQPPGDLWAAPLQAGRRRFGVLVLRVPGADGTLAAVLADLVALGIDRARLQDAAGHDAQRAGRLRAEVMAALSHEMRTPLAAIKGYASALLLEGATWSDDKRREFLHRIEAECDSLQTMITDLLDSSLIDIGQLPIEPQPVRLPRLASAVAEELQRRTDRHRLVIDFPADFPLLDADPGRITQVLRNILDNAIKYSPEGGLIVIKGEVRRADVVVSVTDQGIGIAPEDLIPLFDKFFRGKPPAGHHIAGTGLGLPVARAIVEAHGGRIWAESSLGYGTTLSFSLPLGGLSAAEDE